MYLILPHMSNNAVILLCHIFIVIYFMQDLIVPSLMNKGIDFSVSSLSMVPGIPIKPMLAKYILFHILALS